MLDIPDEFVPGMEVLIAYNPHQEEASEIIGTVAAVQTGEGFLGYDFIVVDYPDPIWGTMRRYSYGAIHLRTVVPPSLIEMAENLEARAIEFRRMAEEFQE